MKRAKILLTAVVLSLGMIPQFSVMAANGEIACDTLIRDNNYTVIRKRGGQPVYRNGSVFGYNYLYTVRSNNRRVSRNTRNLTCVFNNRRNTARLIFR